MKKFNEIIKNEPIFMGVEQRIERDELVGKEIIVHAFKEMNNGEYAIMLCELDEKQFTTSAPSIILEKLRQIVLTIGATPNTKKEMYFKEPFTATITKHKSISSGRDYYDIG